MGTPARPPEDWLAKLERARAKAHAKTGTAWDRYVIDLFDQLSKPTKLSADKAASRFARVPQKGGDVFVSADDVSSNGETSGPPGVQADLNAAGNIGLKALLDPDWHGAWWYIPAGLDANGWRVRNEKSTAGAACLNEWRVGEAKSGLYQSESAGGRALNLSDDQQVQAAAKMVEAAKTRWDAAKAEEWVGLLEANWLIRKGHNLKLTAEYFEPDTDVDENEQNRFSLVWEYAPMEFLQIRTGVRAYDGIPQNSLQNRTEALLQLHGYF